MDCSIFFTFKNIIIDESYFIIRNKLLIRLPLSLYNKIPSYLRLFIVLDKRGLQKHSFLFI